ncbi:unnamed protein product [Cunninghamella blakesleeana]
MVKYELAYFYDGGRGSPIRDILNYVKADWVEVNPEWPAHKPDTPFGYVPYLTITEDDGETWRLAEATVIELYLARRYNLIPPVEEDLKKNSLELQIFNQISELWWAGGVQYVFFPEAKEVNLGIFNKVLDQLIINHEKWLKKNGSTGYYHDQKITLSELVLYSWLNFYHANGLAQQVNEKDTPEIWKAYLHVKNHPNIKPYDYSALTQDLDEN